MAHLIDRDAVLAEIERLRKNQRLDDRHGQGVLDGFHSIEKFIDTLEVKEVNFKPIDDNFERNAVQFCFDNGLNTTPRIARTIAKHFFELGVNASNSLTWEDVRLLDLLCCKVDMSCDLEEKEHYEEVLKRFKARKGEEV